jgi:hypothetical protein
MNLLLGFLVPSIEEQVNASEYDGTRLPLCTLYEEMLMKQPNLVSIK